MSQWIWYPGQFDTWLYNKVHTRRKDYNGAAYPPIWQVEVPHPIMWVRGEIELDQDDEVVVEFLGTGTINLDGKPITPPEGGKAYVSRGKHYVEARIYAPASFPALRISGTQTGTPGNLRVGLDQTTFVEPEIGDFLSPGISPLEYSLPRIPVTLDPQFAGSLTVLPGSPVLIDCGREMYGYVVMDSIEGNGLLTLRFGESREEALADTIMQMETVHAPIKEYRQGLGAAFRYISLTACESPLVVNRLGVEEELGGSTHLGSFECSDDRMNEIWKVSARTLDLCSREFFLDGIKRDHWVWSGDALQEILMSFYLHWDPAICRRTIAALRGKDHMTHHTNIILDYSFYWVLSIWTYYLHTGDSGFLRTIYPKVKSLLDFCAGRENRNGFMEGLPGDWVFVDWAPTDNSGEVALEQILYAQALERAGDMARVVGDPEKAKEYGNKGEVIRDKVLSIYWDENTGAILHNRKSDGTLGAVTKYGGMFALFFGYLDDAKRKRVAEDVLTNPEVLPITTPYMRFYELEALCLMGKQKQVLGEIREYWGGMLDLGATSFWEVYDPREKGAEHYSMYGGEFGKSLCHGWGASPIYLLGKYFLGVEPTSPGYGTFIVTPNPGDLGWMKGSVPIPSGDDGVRLITIGVSVNGNVTAIGIDCPSTGGTLALPKDIPVTMGGQRLDPTGLREGKSLYPLPLGKTEFVLHGNI